MLLPPDQISPTSFQKKWTRNKIQSECVNEQRLPVFRPGNPINNSIIIRYGLIDGHFFLWIAGLCLWAGCVVCCLFRLHADVDVDGTCSVCQMAEHDRLSLCCSCIFSDSSEFSCAQLYFIACTFVFIFILGVFSWMLQFFLSVFLFFPGKIFIYILGYFGKFRSFLIYLRFFSVYFWFFLLVATRISYIFCFRLGIFSYVALVFFVSRSISLVLPLFVTWNTCVLYTFTRWETPTTNNCSEMLYSREAIASIGETQSNK